MFKPVIKLSATLLALTAIIIGTPAVKVSADTVNPATASTQGVQAGPTVTDIKDTKDDTDTVTEVIPASEYDGLAMARVKNYLNLRKSASMDAEVIGKMYDASTAEVLKEGKVWLKIKSGDLTGYVAKKYTVTGEELEEYADENCDKDATVTTTTLKVREKKSTDAPVLTLVGDGETYKVLKEYKDWVKVKLDDTTGFVSKDYVDVEFKFEDAISIEEEQAALAAAQEQSSRNLSRSSDSNSTEIPASATSSSLRQSIADYAVQFVGNPYVWGGTSLTNGADCSGFTMSVLSNFGIGISRTSTAQSSNGSSVSVGNVQVGDLIFYGSGSSIGHVAMYIGNGKVVHASNAKTGIIISDMYYRSPICARNVIG